MDKLGQEPAFPTEIAIKEGKIQECFQTGNYNAHYSGINKRFYAACAAMQGMIIGMPSENAAIWKKSIIERAYKLADELLEQENN